MGNNNSQHDNIFVTYKWLFATAVSMLLITLGFIYFVYAGLDKALDAKADIRWVEQGANVNAARINILTTQLEKMETKQDEMLKELYNIKGLLKLSKKNE